ncbi:MAG TPA: 30S ribosomal protein S20 [Candidatus Omnitrophota bacterium]|nr:30S ribosomal protein S20 [Candidatus Omnitrophota bacterium]HPN55561.1 30S ribosomal protein S20 [Candidatus Omnitrophota bacterium]
MPQRRSGIKELRKNHKNRMRNLDVKTELKKTIKKFLVSVTSNNKTEATTQLKSVYKKLDKAAKRNLIHKNTVARRKSRFSTMANKIAS